MLRRPLTAIELKIDDISEFEHHRRKAKQDKLQKSLSSDFPVFEAGPKSRAEICSRVGYNPNQTNTNK
ncbi:anaphase-promoting complex subunit CDC26-like [Anthonomus grandis grandis]|uniref:anaphase-promoting complex subunit CDC26-like n=1 Tax=Anthonomus grandis grandis TaxID=2921223 RepID=UPI0021663434|nr:anaphase-promoting complex subunit CDC26-like [Anthonomus grandis grandis]